MTNHRVRHDSARRAKSVASPGAFPGWQRVALSLLAAMGLALALSGCVVVPVRPYHPHYYYGY
jgi:hypothetical protein